MQALGNDFVLISLFEPKPRIGLAPEDLARFLCSRHYGLGADGLLLVCPSEAADCKMRIFNPDGTEAEMCGNAVRCAGRYAFEHGVVASPEMTVETLGGLKRVYLDPPDGKIVTAEVGAPDLRPGSVPVLAGTERCMDEPVTLDGREFFMSAMSMGNPFCVSFIDDADTFDLDRFGGLMCRSPLFPRMVNAAFTQVVSPGRLKMRVYERGVGETLACGLGCCASVVAGYLTGRCGSKAVVSQPGGDTTAEFLPAENKLYMTGPVETVYEAEVSAGAMERFMPAPAAAVPFRPRRP
jgi:diaminopimelate epimerase